MYVTSIIVWLRLRHGKIMKKVEHKWMKLGIYCSEMFWPLDASQTLIYLLKPGCPTLEVVLFLFSCLYCRRSYNFAALKVSPCIHLQHVTFVLWPLHYSTVRETVPSFWSGLFICCILYMVHGLSLCWAQLPHPTETARLNFSPFLQSCSLLLMAALLLWLSAPKDRQWTACKAHGLGMKRCRQSSHCQLLAVCLWAIYFISLRFSLHM